MMLNPEDVKFEKIKHTGGYRYGWEFISRINFNVHNLVSDQMLANDDASKVEEYIKKDQLYQLDQLIYSKYRKDLENKMCEFLYEISQYQRTYHHGYSEIVIPHKHVLEFQENLKEIIGKEPERCHNIPISVASVKT